MLYIVFVKILCHMKNVMSIPEMENIVVFILSLTQYIAFLEKKIVTNSPNLLMYLLYHLICPINCAKVTKNAPMNFHRDKFCYCIFSSRFTRLYSSMVTVETIKPFKRLKGTTANRTRVPTLLMLALTFVPMPTMASSGIP